ncbi:MAG TPA: 3-deoxy-7-phosphoheptulonate synthase [Vicinamibacterales bacterium]|jgi:3-deoxy-7-phosphoheptulonate synthase
MLRPTDDLRIRDVRPLIPPAILLEELPLGEQASNVVAEARAAITSVLHGADPRLIVVVGPCSIHDTAAALEYAGRLMAIARPLGDSLVVVMRAYFEKPRTVVGWKGLINDPDLDGSYRINKGLRLARRLLLDVNELGLPTGSEFLDTQIPQHIADLTSWGAIGARTAESQVHRELASGLSMPVGFKNGTDGDTQVAIDALVTARHQHWFPGVTKQGVSAILQTTGNDACHVILRGGAQTGPNYDATTVDSVCAQLTGRGLPGMVMVDCSHGNSQRDHRRQGVVAEDVCRQVASGSRQICGVMIESQLVEGRQDYEAGRDLVYGQSITDACISIEDTARILEHLADAQQVRLRQNP